MKTKQQVIDFLESKVGTKVLCKGNSSLDGQCVTLIKVLMEFLGVPEPYKARGNANTAISAYLSEGIAEQGTGFISVFSNKNMASGTGHIWCNAGEGDGTYYESNGVKPLIVTKGKTYAYDAVCNFDKYIKDEDMATDLEVCLADREKFWKERDEARAEVEQLKEEINKLAVELKECQTKENLVSIKEETTVSGKVGVLNGWTIDSNGVIVANYRIK